MPTYNTRKARRIIQHLRRYGMDGIAAKALTRCGTFNPHDFAAKAPSVWNKQTSSREKRSNKAIRQLAKGNEQASFYISVI